MNQKRFTVHINWFNYNKTEGEIELFDNGQPLLISECIEDVQMIKDLLNELIEENQFLKEKEKDMLDYLKKEYDYVYKQKIKHLDDAILVTSYELIEYHIRSMIEHLERL